jgi:undecaprenyl phosphate N,N'-diacetylbacillosamine 1-phosphate transferase
MNPTFTFRRGVIYHALLIEFHNLRSRLFDLMLAVWGVIFFTPLFLFLFVAIPLDDGGSVFFRQPRLGYRRRPFQILKFRTMRNGSVTRVGKWLRATGLDELAQVFNILKGEMSVVGPRPLTQDDVHRLGWTGREYDARWEIKPGLTCLAGVMGGKTARHSQRLDKLYARHQALSLDIQLIILSFGMNVFGKVRVREWLLKLRRASKTRAT